MREFKEFSPDPDTQAQWRLDYDKASGSEDVVRLASALMAAERHRSTTPVDPAPIYVQLAVALCDVEINDHIVALIEEVRGL